MASGSGNGSLLHILSNILLTLPEEAMADAVQWYLETDAAEVLRMENRLSSSKTPDAKLVNAVLQEQPVAIWVEHASTNAGIALAYNAVTRRTSKRTAPASTTFTPKERSRHACAL